VKIKKNDDNTTMKWTIAYTEIIMAVAEMLPLRKSTVKSI